MPANASVSVKFELRGCCMTKSVRKLDDAVYRQLRTRAARHGVSLEEARQIVSEAVSAPEQVSSVFKKYFGSSNGVDLEIEKHYPHVTGQ